MTKKQNYAVLFVSALALTLSACSKDPPVNPQSCSDKGSGQKRIDGVNAATTDNANDKARGIADGGSTLTYDTGKADGLKAAYQSGYNSGDGYNKAYGPYKDAGYKDGYADPAAISGGASKGTSDAINDGQTQGASDGEEDGYKKGYYDGTGPGLAQGYSDGYSDGYNDGENAAYADPDSCPSTVSGTSVGKLKVESIGGTVMAKKTQVQWDDACYSDGYNSTRTSQQSYNDGFAIGKQNNTEYQKGLADFSKDPTAYQNGVTQGYADGKNHGYSDGYAAGKDAAYKKYYQAAYNANFTNAYNIAYNQNVTIGYNEGTSDGYADAYNQQYKVGSDDGYPDGVNDECYTLATSSTSSGQKVNSVQKTASLKSSSVKMYRNSSSYVAHSAKLVVSDEIGSKLATYKNQGNRFASKSAKDVIDFSNASAFAEGTFAKTMPADVIESLGKKRLLLGKDNWNRLVENKTPNIAHILAIPPKGVYVPLKRN